MTEYVLRWKETTTT